MTRQDTANESEKRYQQRYWLMMILATVGLLMLGVGSFRIIGWWQ
ncbi:hypothetical protein [Periweissella cryptocerci]|nr:hypothetical protein [Periweissella cryptocerci]